MKWDLLRLRAALLASGSLAITGCMSLAAIEPVRAPPAGYQADVTVQVEFLHPARVGARCAERGVSLFGMPMPNAMACANTKLMTLPNPCDTVTGGWYAEALCREIGHSRGWEAEAPAEAPQLMAASWVPDEAVRRPQGPEGDLRRGVAIRVEFVDAGEIGLRCAERGAVAFGRPTLNALSCSSQVMMSLPNPCSLPDAGWYANLLCHEMGHWLDARAPSGAGSGGWGRLCDEFHRGPAEGEGKFRRRRAGARHGPGKPCFGPGAGRGHCPEGRDPPAARHRHAAP